MRYVTTNFRCKHCNALLAKLEGGGVCIRRNDLQVTTSGSDFTVSVCCYRCKTLNVLMSPTATPPPPPGLGSVATA